MDELKGMEEEAASCGVCWPNLRHEQLRTYLSLLKKWNRQINLTSVKDSSELLRFHFLEACWVAENFLPAPCSLADVGSGAGFPGMVMKLYRPELRVCLMEKSYKRSVFLTTLARELLLQVDVFTGLAEKYPSWDGIDLAVFRALKPSSELLRLLLPRGVPLLVLHGGKQPGYRGWEKVREEKFPLSRQRWATLYRADVSRETSAASG
jgi:16S rRNA (guanine527-N7)-methyltransferase